MNRPNANHLSIVVLTALATFGGCKGPDTVEPSSADSPTVAQQQLVAGRPSLADHMREREERRRPRPAPPPKSPAAAAKLAAFERKVAENAPAWAALPPAQREQKRAELKHDMFIGRPQPVNASDKR